jgi:hypothetical protein
MLCKLCKINGIQYGELQRQGSRICGQFKGIACFVIALEGLRLRKTRIASVSAET